MINISILPSSVATKEHIAVPSVIMGVVSIEVQDEQKVYKELSHKLIELETSLNYSLQTVNEIEKMVNQMIIAIDEKHELLLRCEWLVTMSEIKDKIDKITSLEDIKSARAKLSHVQTCPLKKQLMEQLEQKEANLEPVEVILSSKAALVEAIFESGNETFINLGSAGREYVLEEVLANGKGTIEETIANAVALEASVQAAKQSSSTAELSQVLESLPLQHFGNIPTEYVEEVLQSLLDNANWNGLFQLDLQIKHTVTQVYRKHNPVQEGPLTTLVIDEKMIEKLGVQQL
ncbi:hypothetical protein [Lysinibacillus endophyticus]|uniref:hypothetical protein n=1 Tax=Ureibacillus endophyticus TaxID=1978490 RepID=UPI00209E410E|nr:hypothetical protein [Lysinibacillus endophyticus]MCP1143651.1 hypothetical protein [Lysinibacillus endophyticus]